MKAAPVEATIRAGSLAIAIRRYADGRYGFDHQPPGEPRAKVRLHSLADAESRARELVGIARAGKVERTAIDEREYAEFLRWKAEQRKTRNVSDLVPEFLDAKSRKGIAPPSLRDLRCSLTAFARAFPGEVSTLDARAVERWLEGLRIGPRRWNNIRASLVSLMRYARRLGCLPAELSPVERIERRKVVVHVETYTPDELRRLLAVVPPEWLPVVVLGAFAGLRPEEIAPDTRGGAYKPGIQWQNILWKKQKIDVPASVAKDRRRRFAPLLPAARAWLWPIRKAAGPMVPQVKFDTCHRKAWADAAGISWKADGLRHSFASYRLALVPDMARLSLEMGNSPSMIHRHYLDLKHAPEARRWFAVLPL